MKKFKIKQLILVAAIAATQFLSLAQTPFDSFAPSATNSPMLALPEEDVTGIKNDSVIFNSSEQSVNLYSDGTLMKSMLLEKTHKKFINVDPMADKYPGWGPYTYCMNNPLVYVDPSGEVIETVWDAASFAMGAASFIDNAKQGKWGAAALDFGGMLVDGAAVALPCVPGGAGAAIKGARAADKALDMGRAANRAADAANASGDAASLGSKADFYVFPGGQTVPSTGYRAVGGAGADAAKAGDLNSLKDPTYFTFDNIEGMNGKQIQEFLQLDPKNPLPTQIGKFDTKQILDDIKIPTENWNTGSNLEPITKSFPEWGEGGAHQAITNTEITEFELLQILNE